MWPKRCISNKPVPSGSSVSSDLSFPSIWDPHVPDSRVSDVKKRGLYPSIWGPLSRLYCVRCGKRASIASPETMLKVFYVCNDCVMTAGEPTAAIKVPGSEGI